MSQKIIVGVAPERAQETGDALAAAATLAAAIGAELLVVTVVDPASTAEQRTAHEEMLRRAVETTLANAIPRPNLELRVIDGPSPGRTLHELADRSAAAAVVIGASRRNESGETVPGSVGEALLHGGGAAAVVAPHGSKPHASRLGTVAVGYQDTPEGHAALRRGAEIAAAAGAQLRLLMAVEPGDAAHLPATGEAGESEAEHQARERAYHTLREAAASSPVPVQVSLLDGDPARALAIASQGFGLLVLGSRGYGPQRAVLLGPVSKALVRTSACPVMVVPRFPTPQEDVLLAGGMDMSLAVS